MFFMIFFMRRTYLVATLDIVMKRLVPAISSVHLNTECAILDIQAALLPNVIVNMAKPCQTGTVHNSTAGPANNKH